METNTKFEKLNSVCEMHRMHSKVTLVTHLDLDFSIAQPLLIQSHSSLLPALPLHVCVQLVYRSKANELHGFCSLLMCTS